MAAPIINISSVTTSRIGASSGKDTCDVVFQSDQALYEWEARAGGSGIRQGYLTGFSPIQTWQQVDDLVLSWNLIEFLNFKWDDLDTMETWDDVDATSWDAADSKTWEQIEGFEELAAGANGSFRVDNEELTGGDQTYRINVYGKNAAGEWTAYG